MLRRFRSAADAGRTHESIESRLTRESAEAHRAAPPALRSRTQRALEVAERDTAPNHHRWSFATSAALAASVVLFIGITALLQRSVTEKAAIIDVVAAPAPPGPPRAESSRLTELNPARLDRLLERSAAELRDTLDESLKAEFRLLASDTRDAATFVRASLERAGIGERAQ